MRIIELAPEDIRTLARMLEQADVSNRSVKVAVQGDGFIVKVGGGIWSAPLGSEVTS